MKIKQIISFFILAVVVNACFYTKITHMDKEDMQWMLPYSDGERILFCSQYGEIDTLFVKAIDVWNFRNPINNISVGADYLAGGRCDYIILHECDSVACSFMIEKQDKNAPVLLNFVFCERYALDLVQDLHTYKINNIVYKDCVIIDDNNSTSVEQHPNECNIRKIIWSRSKGLVMYEFNNGQKYKMTDTYPLPRNTHNFIY
jgi:hypothetical protein